MEAKAEIRGQTKSLRIAIVQGAFFPVPPLRGGAVEKLWYRLGIEFAKRGHSVTHVSRNYADLPQKAEADGVQYRRVRGYDQPEGSLRLKWCDLLYSRRAIRAVPDSDIIVTNTFWAPILLRHRRGVYVSVERMPKGQIRFYPKAARLRANSFAVEKAIIRETSKAQGRTCVIPNPLPTVPARGVDWEGKRKRILFVGRLHPEKGIELLLEAFTAAKMTGRLEGWDLQIIGPSDVGRGGGGDAWKERLKERFTNPGILWSGPIYDEDKLAECYERASLFAYPSLAEKGETFGLAPLEAMAWGAVPVVSALPCFAEFIFAGRNGFIFDHNGNGRITCLADTLAKAAETNLADMAKEAVLVRETHAVVRIADLFLADFESICRAPAPS